MYEQTQQPPYQSAEPHEAPIPKERNPERFNEEDQDKGTEPCEMCGDPKGHWVAGGIFLCDACDKATKPEEPDPSNPDRELNSDPELPEPVEGDEKTIEIPSESESIPVPDKIEIPERLYNDLMMMIEYSTSNDNEAGGFLIMAKHGEIGVVGEQLGKDREIVLEPNEQLHEGEKLLGTVHMHPVTPTASTGDVTGYMNDTDELVMVVVGADKSINVMIKTPVTAEGDYGEEISDNFEQEDMGMLAEGLGFIWYRGEESDRTTLNLVTSNANGLELDVQEETWPVEDLLDALGIKGRDDIPETYSTKKWPKKIVVPFHWRCNDRLRG
jgi:proteasome lid subunit RPN8/RPN11